MHSNDSNDALGTRNTSGGRLPADHRVLGHRAWWHSKPRSWTTGCRRHLLRHRSGRGSVDRHRGNCSSRRRRSSRSSSSWQGRGTGSLCGGVYAHTTQLRRERRKPWTNAHLQSHVNAGLRVHSLRNGHPVLRTTSSNTRQPKDTRAWAPLAYVCGARNDVLLLVVRLCAGLHVVTLNQLRKESSRVKG